MNGIFWQFLLYGFLGFLLELLFSRAIRHPKLDRKCHLFLPVCPVYGLGAVGILLLPGWVKASPLLLFLGGSLVATLCEWGMSLLYESLAGVSFWDYHALPLNLGGRVCLLFSFFWGLLALPLVYLVQPRLGPLLDAIPVAVTLPAALLYLGDAALSLRALRLWGTEGLRWYRRFTPSEAR